MELSMSGSLDRRLDWANGEGSTFRDEGMSVGMDHMRMWGEDVQMSVKYSDLIIGDRVGAGACSAVHLATHKDTGEKYAIKWFNIFDQNHSQMLFAELNFLHQVDSEAIISMKGAFHDSGRCGLILEYMDRGSLEFLLDPEIAVTEEVMAAIVFQVIWGLGYLHYDNHLHRDIKPGNILMNTQGQVKLSDFGISKELEETTAMTSTAVGSYRYMSPERLLGQRYDASGDIWSLGITVVELWIKRYPLSESNDVPIEIFSDIETNIGNIVNERDFPSSSMRQALQSMVEYEAADRGTSESLASADWFLDCDIRSIASAQQVVADWLRDPYVRRGESKREESKGDRHHHHHHRSSNHK